MRYTPIFDVIVDSSLWYEEPHVSKLFITMLTLMEPDGMVRYDSFKVYSKSRLTKDQFTDALNVLTNPDTRAIGMFEQPFEGRRIEKKEDGWLILNGLKYQEKMMEVNQRAKWARNKRNQRQQEVKMKRARRASSVPDGGEK